MPRPAPETTVSEEVKYCIQKKPPASQPTSDSNSPAPEKTSHEHKAKTLHIMGFISTMARCMRDGRFSQNHTTTKPNPPPQDGEECKDLIKKPSSNTGTTSHPRGESIESTSTIVHPSSTADNNEPIVPAESPARRKQLSPADLNLQTLFENGRRLDAATTNRAVQALAFPEYPVLKLDSTRPPSDTPRKKLQAPVDPGEKMGIDRNMGGKGKESCEGCGRMERAVRKEGGSRLKRSMTALFKRRVSLKLPRSSFSMRYLGGYSSPSWIDTTSLAEEACLVDEKEEKWLEAHGIRGGLDIGHWSGDGMGRAW